MSSIRGTIQPNFSLRETNQTVNENLKENQNINKTNSNLSERQRQRIENMNKFLNAENRNSNESSKPFKKQKSCKVVERESVSDSIIISNANRLN